MEKSASSAESVLQTLVMKGWCFRDDAEMISLIQKQSPPFTTNSSPSLLVDSIESELLNMDLRNIGGKSLQQTSSNKKTSHLPGPKILQLVSLRDIQQSSIDSSFGSKQHVHHRLLRFVLTDGQSEVVAIEYAPFLNITEDIIPGCKIRLEGKATVHYGILCLTPRDIKILGGHVQSLHEEWEISQKYSGFSRSFIRPSQGDDVRGPPPFVKLQTGDTKMMAQLHSSNVGDDQSHQKLKRDQHPQAPRKEKVVDGPKFVPSQIKTEDKPSDCKARPKEVVDAVPVQNQAAAQKLLQKMHDDRNTRGHKSRFKGKREESQVFTLEEWERRKASASNAATISAGVQDISRDEELARRLQAQLDIEDCQEYLVNAGCEAEQIRMSMFNFGGSEERKPEGRVQLRGRGRGRGRGRKRFG